MAINELGQRVATRLTELGKKPIPAAESVGLGRDYIRDLIEGRKESISQKKAPLVAEACEWTLAELQQEAEPRSRGTSRKRVVMVPLLDNVQAGRLTSPVSQIPADKAEKLAFSDLGPGDYFALKVQGSSMDKVSPEGSIIVVNKRDRQLINGRFYVFSVRGDTTYKRWNAKPGYLEPYTNDTDAHKPIIITKKGDVEVIGRVRRTVLDL